MEEMSIDLNEEKRERIIDNNFGKVNKQIKTNNNLINDNSFETISQTNININSNQNECKLTTSERHVNINAFYSANDSDSHDFHPLSEEESLFCSNECLDESEKLENKSSKTKTSEEVNENNIIDKQSINSLIKSFDKQYNKNIDTNGEKVNNSKSCETQSRVELKGSESLTEEYIDFEIKCENEPNVCESISFIDIDIDSSETEVDSHFDDNNKRKKTVKKSNSLSKKFKCDFTGCGKIYRHKKSLNDHKLSDGNANFKCDFIECNYKTYNKNYLREHQKTHLREKRFNFNECKASFKFKSNLIKHQNKGHNSIGIDNVLKCDSITDSCDQNFKNESQFECNENGCRMKFKFRWQLNKHRKRKHSNSTQFFKCDSIGCSFSTNNSENLKKHQNIHDLTAIQRVKCDICSKIYESVTAFKSLREHQKRKHFELFPEFLILNCQKCDFKTKSSPHLNEHNESHNPKENSIIFRCDFANCSKSYTKKQKLNEHKRTTHLGIVYKCDFENCKKVFRNIDRFRKHKLRHKGIKDFVCNQCGKSFYENRLLRNHLNSHTGLKPYVCEWPGCEKRFANSSLLSGHRRYHINDRKNDRKYVCDWPQCEYKTGNKYHLDKHTAKHTGEKKFECFWPGCQYKTADRSNLKSHQKQHK
jgi:KRAB domain-containing zinc finger protein